MRKKIARRGGLTLALMLVATVVFFVAASPLQPPVTHQLTVKKVKNNWLVVQGSDTVATVVNVRRGEKIVWTAEGSDLYFQFMDGKLFGDYTRHIKDGKKLTLVVGVAARKGVHEYAVFCLKDKEFARGSSPPSINIIE